MADEIEGLVVTLTTATDEAAVNAAFERLEALALDGNAIAQRVGLGFIYHGWTVQGSSYAEFVHHIGVLLKLAAQQGTLRDLILLPADKDTTFAHAEFVCALDVLADGGDDAAMVVIAQLADLLPAATIQMARRLRLLPVAGEAPTIIAPAADSLPVRWPEPSRWELARWWLSDRWWDCRWWVESRMLGLQLVWWGVKDWRASP